MLEISVNVEISGELVPRVYKYDPNRLMNTEIKAVQRLFNVTLEQLAAASTSDIDVVDAIVWLCRTRDGEKDLTAENLEYDYVSFTVKDLDAPAADGVDPTEPQPSQPSSEIPATS